MFYHQTARQIRKEKKVRISRLAAIIGKTRQTVSSWEKGHYSPCEAEIRLIAQVLDVPVSLISDISEFSNNTIEQAEPDIKNIPIHMKRVYNSYLESNATIARLRSSLFNYENLLQRLPFSIFVKNRKLKYTYINDCFLNLIGHIRSKETIYNTSASDIFEFKEYASILEQEQRVIQTKKILSDFKIFIPGTLKKRVGLLTIIPCLNTNKEVEEIVCFIQDITDSQEEQNKRKDLENITNKLNQFTWIGESDDGTEESFRYSFLSDSIINIYGIKKQDILENNRIWLDIIHEDDFEWVNQWNTNNWKGAKKFSKKIIFRINNPNKGVCWISSETFREENKFYGIDKDITEEVKKNEQLQLLADTMNNIEGCVLITTNTKLREKDDFKILFVSDGFEQIFETSKQSFHKDPFYLQRIIHPGDKKRINKVWDMCNKGLKKEISINYRVIVNGKEKLINDHAKPLGVINGNPVRFGLITEIT